MELLLAGLRRRDWSQLLQNRAERLVALRWRGKVDFFFLRFLHGHINLLFSLYQFASAIFHILSVFDSIFGNSLWLFPPPFTFLPRDFGLLSYFVICAISVRSLFISWSRPPSPCDQAGSSQSNRACGQHGGPELPRPRLSASRHPLEKGWCGVVPGRLSHVHLRYGLAGDPLR